MPSLALFTNIFSEPSSRVALKPKRCLRRRLNTNQCKSCLDICPTGALRLNGREIALDEAKCSGCMACVTACPQDALVNDYDLGKFLGAFRADRDIVVSCVRQAQSHPDEITVPCVGILSKQVLTAIVVSGCKTVTFNIIGCSECCNRNVSNTFIATCKQISETFSYTNSATLILANQKGQLQNANVDRRFYLAKLQKLVIDVTPKYFSLDRDNQIDKKKTTRRLPYKTQLVKKLVAHSDQDSQKKILALFGHRLSVSDDCTCCPLCKGICPTGAISIERSEQVKTLKFEMLDCSGCGLCVEFCKKGALSLERLLSDFSI